MVTPPRLIVSKAEYDRELRNQERKLRTRKFLWSERSRALSYWRWRREMRWLEAIRGYSAAIKRISDEIKAEWLKMARKVVKPYWRIQKIREYWSKPREETPEFEAEYRVYLFTLEPEKFIVSIEEPKQPSLLHELLNELEYVVSKMAARRHDRWSKAVNRREDWEAIAIPETEVELPMEDPHYYVRIVKDDGTESTYGNEEIKGWLRYYEREVERLAAIGQIKYPDLFKRWVRRTTLDEWAKHE